MQPHHPGSPYPAPPQRITPSGWWFAFGGLLIAIGVLGGLGLGVFGITQTSSKIDDFQRIAVPGSGDLRLAETGGYTVYFEDTSGGGYGGRVNIVITDPSGSAVPLNKYDATVTYSFGKHSGEAAFSFEAKQPGTYHVTTKGDPGVTAAIGRGLGSSFVYQLFAALGVGGGGLLLGLVVIIVVAVKRSGSKRRAAQAGGYPPGPPQFGPREY
ncbi:hypothetical protein ACQPW1_47090 [Nocardia sp. CA-128927]|uniref:hypothetical protein n=1 Tax=Nocardia sp. CA-128927 TaxID=3239975 RepID=UPI003D957B6D